MKKILGTILICLISCLMLCSCSTATDNTATASLNIDTTTEDGFWEAMNYYENEANLIFDEIRKNQKVTKNEVRNLEILQEQLEKTYDEARESSYYDQVSWFVDGGWGLNFLVIIDTDNYSSQYGDITYSRSSNTFTISENYGKCALFLQNAEGPTVDPGGVEDYYKVLKEYTILNSNKDAYILVQGIETGTILYIIVSHTASILRIVVLGLLIGIFAFIFSIHEYKKAKNNISKHIVCWCGIIPATLMILGAVSVLLPYVLL